MNLCFSTLGCAEYPLPEILSLCRKFGISFLELRGIGGELDFSKIPDLSEKQIENTNAQFRADGVIPLILGTSCKFHDAEQKQKAIPEGLAALRYARQLGALGIRVFGDRLTDDPVSATRNVIEGLQALCREAQKTGEFVLLEVHGEFCTVEALSPILAALQDEPCFGLIWDLAHTHHAYRDDWLSFYEAAVPFIRHVHIKDVGQNGLVLPGDGEIPILPIVSRLLSDGYAGAFSLEWERKWHPELPPIETALEKFVSLMGCLREAR